MESTEIRPQRTTWAGGPAVESVDQVCWGVRRVMQRWQVPEHVTAQVVTIVIELALNSVIHAHSAWRLVIDQRGPVLYVAVDDAVAEPLPRPADPTGDCLTGLQIVDSVASRWGWQEHETGKTVWAELLA